MHQSNLSSENHRDDLAWQPMGWLAHQVVQLLFVRYKFRMYREF